MLKKVNGNLMFVNCYNGFVENDLLGIDNNFSVIFKYLSDNQLMIVKRYLKYNMLDNVMLFLKNIAYKKVNQIKNYCYKDIEF